MRTVRFAVPTMAAAAMVLGGAGYAAAQEPDPGAGAPDSGVQQFQQACAQGTLPADECASFRGETGAQPAPEPSSSPSTPSGPVAAGNGSTADQDAGQVVTGAALLTAASAGVLALRRRRRGSAAGA